MRQIELAATVEAALNEVAKKTDDLFSDEAIGILGRFKRQGKSKNCPERFELIKKQLPDGIYTTVSQVITLVNQAKKRVTSDPISFSPLVLEYPEFKPCKTIRYQTGHIITGREAEIEKILLTLCKGSKRGVVLVGEAGVGKSSVVNAINARLIERTVPRQLIGAQILNLDIPYIFTKFKEDPLGTIIKVLERASTYDKAILFIDEVHQLLGHKMNDIMKPYLTEQIRFIGCTTTNEYHAIITEDSALERRFTLIRIDEPSIPKTVEIVKGTKSVFEEQHKCIVSDEVCEYLVINGSRFLGHRRNPDKSLDILDIACALMNEREIKEVYDKVIPSGNFLDDLERDKREIESIKLVPGNRTLTNKYVNLAISSTTGIPYDEIKNSLEYSKVFEAMKSGIFGQDEGIKSLANTVNVFKHIGYDRERPVEVLLLLGPRGCGKKSAAKLLARTLFGSEESFIEYDMSGMTSEFMITELKGSPPGYVGYGRSGGLIKKLRNTPQCVLYFRGINKADSTIVQYLIDCCRHGKITDSAEREASLNNAVVIYSITLTEGEEDRVLGKSTKSMGFKPAEDRSSDKSYNEQAAKGITGEELYESVDEVIVFNKLNEETLDRIFEKNVDQFTRMYDVDIDREELKKSVLKNAKNGHDVISRLTSEVPKMAFRELKKE